MQPFYKQLNFPKTAVNSWLDDTLHQEGISLKIVTPRKRKLGDYRYNFNLKTHQITINNDLNEDLFTVTLIHELAHKFTLDRFGRTPPPHGMEWKLEFRKLLNEALQLNPSTSIRKALVEHIQQPRASFKSTSGEKIKNTAFQQLKEGDEFTVTSVNKTFVFQKKLRTRYQCIDKCTGKIYSISPYADVVKCN